MFTPSLVLAVCPPLSQFAYTHMMAEVSLIVSNGTSTRGRFSAVLKRRLSSQTSHCQCVSLVMKRNIHTLFSKEKDVGD